MNPWETRLKQSPAISQAHELRTLIADLLRDKEFSEDVKGSLERVDLVATTVISQLESCDPRLVDEGTLNAIGNGLSDAHTHVDHWTQGMGEDYLKVHVQAQLDNALHALASIPRPDVKSAEVSVAALRSSVNGYRVAFANAEKRLEGKVEEIQSDLEKKVASTRTDVVGLDDDLKTLQKDFDKVEANLQTMTTTQQSAFTKAETDRSESFARLLGEKQKELEEEVGKIRAAAGEQAQKSQGAMDEKVKAAEESQTQIEEILGIVSEKSLISDYSKSAESDRTAANIWRRASVGALLAAVGAAVWLIHSVATDTGINWYKVVAKILMSGTLSGLAFYAARQSAEHRNAQRDAERMALQLVTLKPFLSGIDDKLQRDVLLGKITLKLFGGKPKSAAKKGWFGRKEADKLMPELFDLLKELVKNNKP